MSRKSNNKENQKIRKKHRFRMPLPQYNKRKAHNRKKFKVCQYKGCGVEYWGHPISKYCAFHQDVHNRDRVRKKFESVEIKNQLLDHKFSDVIEIEFTCALPECQKKFRLKIYPKQHVYPKYCEEHRMDYRRGVANLKYDR